MIKKHNFIVTPLANVENMITGDKYRITFLTRGLIRFEYSEQGIFEDRATQVVVNRDFEKCEYKIVENSEVCLRVTTEYISLYYNKKEFSANGLYVKIKNSGTNYNDVWHYGMKISDLGGTARTLDNIDGATKLDHGVISRSGFSVLDDSNTSVFDDNFIKPRKIKGIDIYLFGYGKEYYEAIKDFYRLCGSTPMLPRYALGNWWSRYYKYTEESYKKLMEQFDKENIPFSVAVIDMDWHLVDIPSEYGSGWTGYSWNREFFPEPERFLTWLHDRGMKVTLNVHPADGIRAYEDAYEDMALAMGIDPETKEAVEFDSSNPEFLKNYFEQVHHPLEKQGVDFWWIDWQQGADSKVEGLDPLWILNHYHFIDNGRDGKRPMTFSRYAGPGSHRYPIGFSGDTHITWDSLEFQPYFTATASNIGYGWWSHDIGGHMHGRKDNQLELRWYQFGIFSPIMRLHSSNSEFVCKEPWKFNCETRMGMGVALRFRHKMIPYLYTMNYRAYNGIPLIVPMYYDDAYGWDSYDVNTQYRFGSELIVAPITTPNKPVIDMGKVRVFLPKGYYFDIFTGIVYKGGRYVNMFRDNMSIPVLAKEGAIIPLTEDISENNFINNPKQLDIMIYPGEDNEFVLYEDDNESVNYLDGVCVRTTFINKVSSEAKFIINKPEGETGLLPASRRYVLRFMSVENTMAAIKLNGTNVECTQSYDEDKNCISVILDDSDYTQNIVITFEKKLTIKPHSCKDMIYKLLERAELNFYRKDDIYRAILWKGTLEEQISELIVRCEDHNVMEAVIEILTAYVDSTTM